MCLKERYRLQEQEQQQQDSIDNINAKRMYF